MHLLRNRTGIRPQVFSLHFQIESKDLISQHARSVSLFAVHIQSRIFLPLFINVIPVPLLAAACHSRSYSSGSGVIVASLDSQVYLSIGEPEPDTSFPPR